MLFKNISILDENFEIKNNMFVLVVNDKIQAISTTMPICSEQEEIDGTNLLLMPGFYNTHTHIPMGLLRGYGENLPLDSWLKQKVFPFEAKLIAKDVYNATVFGIAQMLSFGIVSFSDMYFFSDEIVRAVDETKIKANIARAVTCFDDSELFDLSSFNESKQLFEKYNNYANERIKIDLSLHAEYTSTPKVVKSLAEYAKSVDATIHIHLSETNEEHNECINKYGKTPTKYFYDLGVFDSHTLLAHCVYLTDEDIEIIKSSNATIVHNPVSNLKLGSGVAPLYKFIDKGVNVSLGTDGVCSNNNLNILSDLKVAALLQKGIHNNPSLVTEKQGLQMLTSNGAKAQRRLFCDGIKEGNKADFVVLNLDSPNMLPKHNILSNIIYSSQPNDIKMTVVDGEVLYNNNEFTTIDIEKAKFELNASTKRILSELE